MTTQILTSSIEYDEASGDYAVRINGDIVGHRATYGAAEQLRTEEISKRLPWNAAPPLVDLPDDTVYAPEALHTAWSQSHTTLYWMLSRLTPEQLAQQARIHAAWLHERCGQAASFDSVLSRFRSFITTFDPSQETPAQRAAA